MVIGSVELFLIVSLLLGLVGLGLWVWALADLLKFEDSAWAVAGQNKVLWIVLLVLFGCLGALLYLTIPRPKLLAATH